MNDRRARYVRNHDGDSVTMLLDQGFYQTFQPNIRLANVWAPESGDDGYTDVKYFVRDWFMDHMIRGGTTKWPFIVTTHQTSADTDVKTFDRFVADITTRDGRHSLNSEVMRFILENGYPLGAGAPIREVVS